MFNNLFTYISVGLVQQGSLLKQNEPENVDRDDIMFEKTDTDDDDIVFDEGFEID